MTQGVDFLPHFRVLGLHPGASAEEIREAYLDMVKVWHPDRFAHDPGLQARAGDKLRQINIAYGALRSYCSFAPPRTQPYIRSQPAPSRPYRVSAKSPFNPSHRRILSWPATLVLLALVTFWPVERSGDSRAHDEVRQPPLPSGVSVKKPKPRRTLRRAPSRAKETTPGLKPGLRDAKRPWLGPPERCVSSRRSSFPFTSRPQISRVALPPG